MSARWSGLAAVISVAAMALHATADPAGADRAAADAQQLAERGDFVGAAAKYREAFREHPRPDLMCNVGVAYYKAKALPRAHRYLDQCLQVGGSLDPAFIANVQKVLAAVEQKLAADKFTPLNLIVQPDTATTTITGSVHDEPLVGSRRVWLPFGNYRVTVRAAGFVDQILEITATRTQAIEHSVKLVPAPPRESNDDAATGSGAVTAELGSATTTVVATPAVAPPAQRSLLAPMVATAATAAFGGLALGVYLSALSKASDAGDASTSTRHASLEATARSRQHISWAVAGVSGAAAIVAGILWYRALRSPARVDVTASGTAAAVMISGRW